MASASPLAPGAIDPPSARRVVRVRRVEGSPVVSLRAWVRGGSRVAAWPGLGLVAGRLLGEGTRHRDYKRIAEDAEARGMALIAFGGFEAHGVAIDALAADWERAVDWLAELVLEPAFPEERCAFIVRQTQAELESLADQADILTGWAFLEQLYTPHPFAWPVQGDAASLARILPEDCARHHAAGLERGVVLTAAGAIDEAAIRERLEQRFAALAGAPVPAAEPPAPRGLEAPRREIRTRARDQAHLYVGHLTVPRRHSDWAALDLLSVVLGAGAGLTGRIPMRVREQEGLAYTALAATTAGAGADPGRLVAYVGTAPESVARAERAVAEEIERLLVDGVEEHEVAEARGYLLGREPFRRETARQWADLLGESELFGLPVDRAEWVAAAYAALDRPTVDAAARRHLDARRLQTTVGLPGGEELP